MEPSAAKIITMVTVHGIIGSTKPATILAKMATGIFHSPPTLNGIMNKNIPTIDGIRNKNQVDTENFFNFDAP